MTLLVLSYEDVERLLPMEECVDVMEDALASLARGEMFQPLRSITRPPGSAGLIGLMPAYRGGARPVYALKALTVTPDNPALHGLDAHQGGVLLSDGKTGELVALVNASAITEIRTAAVSAVATRYLAREDARQLAIIGAGVQARSHLRAMAAVRPFAHARIWSPTARNAQRLAEEAADAVPFPAEAVGSAEEAVRGADVVVTATPAREPVVRRDWLNEGVHLNAVGSAFPHARELDGATIAAAKLVVDRRESAESEAGDYLLAVKEGAIGADHIHAELGDVVIGAADGRTSAEEITLFKSLGIAVEDLAAADYVVRKARAEGVGAEVAF